MWGGAPYQVTPVAPIISPAPYLVYGATPTTAYMAGPSYMATPQLAPYGVRSGTPSGAGIRLPPLNADPVYGGGGCSPGPSAALVPSSNAYPAARPVIQQQAIGNGYGYNAHAPSAGAAPAIGAVAIRPQHQSSGPHNIIAGIYLDDGPSGNQRRQGGGYVYEGAYQNPWGNNNNNNNNAQRNLADMPAAGARKVPRGQYNIVTGQAAALVNPNGNGQHNDGQYVRNNNDFQRNGMVAMVPEVRNIASSGAPYDILTGQSKILI